MKRKDINTNLGFDIFNIIILAIFYFLLVGVYYISPLSIAKVKALMLGLNIFFFIWLLGYVNIAYESYLHYKKEKKFNELIKMLRISNQKLEILNIINILYREELKKKKVKKRKNTKIRFKTKQKRGVKNR